MLTTMQTTARPRVGTIPRAKPMRTHSEISSSPRKPPTRHTRQAPMTEFERKAAITEVVRKARGVETRGEARRSTASASTSASSALYALNAGDAEIAPAMELVEVLEPETNRRLLCMLRRRFTAKGGRERCLVLPVDTPVDVLRGEGLDENEDLSDIGDEELGAILPDMNRALALRGFLLQRSAFCMTVRGAVRMNEDDVLEMDTGGDEPNEGVEVCTFSSGGSRYLVYAPLNPVLLLTREDPETKLHEVCFDEDVDEESFQRNMDAEYELLSEPEDDLFADLDRA